MLRLVRWLARVAEPIVSCPMRALRFVFARFVFNPSPGRLRRRLETNGVCKRTGPQAFLNPVPAIHGRARAGALAFAGCSSTKAGELMRVVAGSGSLWDLGGAEIDRHLETMARFIERLEGGEAAGDASEASPVTMILRSAQSAPAQALISMTEELARVRASAKVVLAKLEPEEDLRQLFASLWRLGPCEPAQELVRWARNPRLLEAHEQVTYGTAMCWSGDAMRRDADRRNGLTQFDEAAPQAARLGRLAFEALWAASAMVPERRLLGPSTARPSGAYQSAADPGVAISPLRPSLRGWPLVRH
jgi:hypothetical protein